MDVVVRVVRRADPRYNHGPNKCQKRPTIGAKETYYVRTFESYKETYNHEEVSRGQDLSHHHMQCHIIVHSVTSSQLVSHHEEIGRGQDLIGLFWTYVRSLFAM